MSAGSPAADAAGARLYADCVRTLRAYAPDSDDQKVLRHQFLQHLDDHPDGWSRECPGAHLTASSLVCTPNADRVLLLHHRKLDRWLQTGGHVERGDTTIAGAALREAVEESGLGHLRLVPGVVHLDAHEVPCGPVRPCYHLDVRFLVIADGDRVPAGSPEALAVGWFSGDDLPTDEPSVTVLVEIAQARLGIPTRG